MELTTTVRPLDELEATIERGLATFIEVGEALLEIREHDLYPDHYEDFAAYCRGRWGFTDRRARQLIQAAEIGRILPTPPARASHAEALAPLKDDSQAIREIWAEVQEATNGKPTAAALSAAIQRRVDPTPDPDFADDDVEDVSQEYESDDEEDTVADAVADGYVLPPRGLRPARKAWYAALSPSHYERIPPEDVIATAEPKELEQSLGSIERSIGYLGLLLKEGRRRLGHAQLEVVR